jgi:AbrB family looped-hinge helix DNA binding protein
MFATLTSKGQLTLPKEIRDRLNLDAGAILDFQIQDNNTITARHTPSHAVSPRPCSRLRRSSRRKFGE